jgi:hypothetical protein
LSRKESYHSSAGKILACRQMMILVEGEQRLSDVPILKDELRMAVSVNFFVLFFSYFYDSFTKKFREYLLGYVMSWVSVQSH